MFRALSALLASLLFCALLTGCGGPTVKDRLVGKWTGTLVPDDALIAQTKAENPIQAVMVESFLKAIASNAKFDVELKADGTTNTTMLGKSSTGKWELKSATGNQAVIVTKENNSSTEITLTLDEDFLKGTGGFSMDLKNTDQVMGKIKFKRAA
jgi:hypothetical protein